MSEKAGTGRAVVLALLTFSVMLGVVAYFGAPRARLRPQAPPGRALLAVLPFENLSGEPELEVLAAEVTAAITERLSARDELEVVPREKSLQFKGVPGGLESVTERLGADYVITGSLDLEGDRIEVDAYLYRAGPEAALWADRLDWEAAEQHRLPAELARRVDGALAERD